MTAVRLSGDLSSRVAVGSIAMTQATDHLAFGHLGDYLSVRDATACGASDAELFHASNMIKVHRERRVTFSTIRTRPILRVVDDLPKSSSPRFPVLSAISSFLGLRALMPVALICDTTPVAVRDRPSVGASSVLVKRAVLFTLRAVASRCHSVNVHDDTLCVNRCERRRFVPNRDAQSTNPKAAILEAA